MAIPRNTQAKVTALTVLALLQVSLATWHYTLNHSLFALIMMSFDLVSLFLFLFKQTEI
eukprot:m.382214 g.382214  ORF g.382214 m.382214 type:complete len:59 (+) comp114982_c0_seq1:122-298(+)